MADDKFSWKSLFINDDSTPAQKDEVKSPSAQTETRFPSSNNDTRFPDQTQQMHHSTNAQMNPFINEIIGVYEKGFDSLNLADFDFFELYKSVLAVGITNPQSYQMAFTMGKSIKPDLTKEFLLEKSKFYIEEIEKVYTKFNATGTTRKNDLDMSITRDKVNLTKSISDLEIKILELQKELESKKMELSRIDSDNQQQFSEIQLKIEANNFAKHKILDSINLVVTGINQYL
jgi:hypothetical protein